MCLLVFGHVVVALLALRTCQCNLNSHDFHLHLVLFRLLCPKKGHKKKTYFHTLSKYITEKSTRQLNFCLIFKDFPRSVLVILSVFSGLVFSFFLYIWCGGLSDHKRLMFAGSIKNPGSLCSRDHLSFKKVSSCHINSYAINALTCFAIPSASSSYL